MNQSTAQDFFKANVAKQTKRKSRASYSTAFRRVLTPSKAGAVRKFEAEKEEEIARKPLLKEKKAAGVAKKVAKVAAKKLR